MTPAERLKRLREKYGSHDKLAAAVNTRFGTRLTRQTLIRMEKTGVIGRSRTTGHDYAVIFATLNGSTPEDFRPSPARMQELFRSLEERVRAIEERLEDSDRPD
jgi:hypothetical protein